MGELNRAVPALCAISKTTIRSFGENSVRLVAMITQATADTVRPPTVRPREPNLSDRRPLMGPSNTMHMAGGMSNSPTSLGDNSSTRCM